MFQRMNFFREDLSLRASPAVYLRLIVSALAYLLASLGLICQIGALLNINRDCPDGPKESCNDFLRYDWWTTDYQLMVAIALVLTQVYGIHRYLATNITVFVTVAIVQLINSANKYLDMRNGGDHYKTAAVGYILSAMGFMLLALAIGGEIRIKPSHEELVPIRRRSHLETTQSFSFPTPASRTRVEASNGERPVHTEIQTEETITQRYRNVSSHLHPMQPQTVTSPGPSLSQSETH